MPKHTTFFPTSQDAETAFYEALEKGNLADIMSVWSEDEEIVCIHPGGTRLSNYIDIRESFNLLFVGAQRLSFHSTLLSTLVTPFTAIHSVREQITINDEERLPNPVISTNIFVKGPLGWRLVLHHASVTPPEIISAHVTVH